MPSNPKTVVITTPGEIAAFSSLPPLDLGRLLPLYLENRVNAES